MQLHKTQFEALSNRMFQSVSKVLIRNITNLHYLQCNVTAKQCKSDETQWIKRSNFLSVELECPQWKSIVLYSCALQSTPHALWEEVCCSVTSYLLFYSNFLLSLPPSLFSFILQVAFFLWVFAFFLYVLNYLLHSGPHKCTLPLSFCVCVTGYSRGRVKLVAVL